MTIEIITTLHSERGGEISVSSRVEIHLDETVETEGTEVASPPPSLRASAVESPVVALSLVS